MLGNQIACLHNGVCPTKFQLPDEFRLGSVKSGTSFWTTMGPESMPLIHKKDRNASLFFVVSHDPKRRHETTVFGEKGAVQV